MIWPYPLFPFQRFSEARMVGYCIVYLNWCRWRLLKNSRRTRAHIFSVHICQSQLSFLFGMSSENLDWTAHAISFYQFQWDLKVTTRVSTLSLRSALPQRLNLLCLGILNTFHRSGGKLQESWMKISHIHSQELCLERLCLLSFFSAEELNPEFPKPVLIVWFLFSYAIQDQCLKRSVSYVTSIRCKPA